MRITNSMMIDNMLTNLNSGLNKLNKYNNQLSSNRKITRLSDDPVGVLNSMNARQKIKLYQQYQSNLDTARSWVDQTDSYISDMNGIITKIKENVIDATSTKNTSDKTNIATLVSELKNELFQLSNASLGTKYIFGGYNTTSAPFTQDENGNVLYNGIDLSKTTKTPVLGTAIADTANATSFSWTGNITASPDKYKITATGDTITISDSEGQQILSKQITTASGTNTLDLTAKGLGIITWTDNGSATGAEVAGAIAGAGYVTTEAGYEVAQNIDIIVGFGVTMDVTFSGVDIVGTGADNTFSILGNLISDLKGGASNEELSKYLTSLQTIQDRLLVSEVQVGARSQKLDTLENRYSEDLINYESVRSSVEDIDQAEVIMNYKLSQSIYEQALATGAKVIQPSLMDFLD